MGQDRAISAKQAKVTNLAGEEDVRPINKPITEDLSQSRPNGLLIAILRRAIKVPAQQQCRSVQFAARWQCKRHNSQDEQDMNAD